MSILFQKRTLLFVVKGFLGSKFSLISELLEVNHSKCMDCGLDTDNFFQCNVPLSPLITLPLQTYNQ